MPDGNGKQVLHQQLQTLHQQLQTLMEKGLTLPTGDPQRRVLANRIIRLIQQSGKLWRASGTDQDFYEDALMLTWKSFCRNLWEETTAKTGAYSKPDCNIVARLNAYLKRRVGDLANEARLEAQQRQQQWLDRESNLWIDPIDQVAAPPHEPQDLRSAVENWLVRDTTTWQVHVRGKPEITVAWLIREYLLADRKWKEVSAMALVPISTLSSFYERECRPRLQVFCQEEEYW
jgi:hypothetical protein